MMNYEDFKEMVLLDVAEMYDSVKLQTIQKQNYTYDGIIITTDQETIVPIINVTNEYENYKQHGYENCVSDIIQSIEISRLQNLVDFKTFYLTFHPEQIIEQLIATAENEDYLQNAVITKVQGLEDLVVIYRMQYQDTDTSMLITNQLVDSWGIKKEDVIASAKHNRQYFITSIQNILLQLLPPDPDMEIIREEIQNTPDDKYILTNQQGKYGAAGIMDTDLLTTFAKDMDSENVIILPASIHEVLLLPHAEIDSAETFKQIVTEINHSYVDLQDRLTDNVYVFNRSSQNIITIDQALMEQKQKEMKNIR